MNETGNGPVCLTVPIGDFRETDLMAALEFVVRQYERQPTLIQSDGTPADTWMEVSRAVFWLNEKFKC